MSWFRKIAKNFSDRNAVNEKIIYLSGLKNQLGKLSKLVFQSATMTKKSTFDIVNSKKITSYPIIQDILIEANNVIYDSPYRFSKLCAEAQDRIQSHIVDLKEERTKLTRENEDGSVKVEKGWKYER